MSCNFFIQRIDSNNDDMLINSHKIHISITQIKYIQKENQNKAFQACF
jgi:hypothetical protein